jgi:hypothetical protein
VWSALSADQKSWLQAAADEVSRTQPAKALALEHDSRTQLQKIGVKFATDVDKSGFQKIAVRCNDHLYLAAIAERLSGKLRLVLEVFNHAVVLAVGLAMVVFGWQNFLQGFGSFRMPSMTPIAYLYWPIPVCGALIALFSVEQIVNGVRHGFAATDHHEPRTML